MKVTDSRNGVLGGLLALVIGALPLAACSGETTGGGDSDSTDGDGSGVDAGPNDPDSGPGPGTPDAAPLEKFSFFVTSLDTMRLQSGSQDGFGGNLGGLAGADMICQTAAANVGFGMKTWRAFLSTSASAPGGQTHAIDRIGTGPWYDRNGRLVANDLAGLLNTRPAGDAQSVNDLPDEYGQPGTALGDTHDIMTASNAQGRFDGTGPGNSCQDWTSSVGPGSEEQVRLGHSWPAMSGQSWIAAHRMRGCSPGVNLVQNGPGSGDCVGCGGGWGGIYCFALEP